MFEDITVTLLDGTKKNVNVWRVGFIMGDSQQDRAQFLPEGAGAGLQLDEDPYPYVKLLLVRETPAEVAKMCNDLMELL